MKPMPIKWRIALLVAAVLVAVIVTLSCVAYHEMEESLKRNIDNSLTVMADGIRGAVEDTTTPEATEREVRAITGNSPHGPHNTIYRVWRDDSDTVLSTNAGVGSSRAARLQAAMEQKPPPTDKLVFMDLSHNGRYRAIRARYAIRGGNLNVLILRSSEHAYGELREFLRLLLILGGSVVVGSIAAVTVIVLLALRPVGQTAARLAGITHRNLGADHLANLQSPVELRPFVEAVNQLLRRLDDAIQRQEQFTSDASHEIRTPLALAKSTLQAVGVKDRPTAEYKEAIAEVVGDLDRIQHLTEQLLLLARMDATARPPEGKNVQLDELLRQLAEAFDKRATQTGGRVVCGDLPLTRIRGDEQQLSHVFGNLLDNAVKHGPTGGSIRITLEHVPLGVCTVVIHDDGHIAPDILPRLFDRFYRSDPSRARATGGSGLGLAIARKIARLHGGDIIIRSDADGGTNVTVRLPRSSGDF